MIASRADGTVWAPDEAGTVYARIMIVMIAQLFDQAHHILSQWANVEIAKRLDFLFDPTSEPLTGAMVFIEAREPLAAIELTEC